MRSRRLFWHLYPSYLLITLAVVAAVSWYAADALHRFHRKESRRNLEAKAALAQAQLDQMLKAPMLSRVDRLCSDLAERAEARLTVILPDGTVVGDSEKDPEEMENHANRAEIRQALLGETGTAVRPSPTLQKEMMYVALPVEADGRLLGVVRTSLPVTSLRQSLRPFYKGIALAAVVIAAVAGAVSLLVSRRISGPLEELERGAKRFARGELDHKISRGPTEEVGAVADAMNLMAARLGDRIRTVIRQRNELEAVLGSMAEGVMAVDQDQRIIRMNPAAARLLDCEREGAEGRLIQEVVRNPGLQSFAARALSSEEGLQADLVLPAREGERCLQARATSLRDAEGEPSGMLLVLNDVTRLRRLQGMRREFVANVSHELRTPITAIKGFAETLREEWSSEAPEEHRRFLEIICHQADRLQELFDDLLTISRTERHEERGEIDLETGLVEQVVETAVEMCRARAEEKDIHLVAECDENLRAELNPPLLEQAVFNLLDNAVRYSPPESTVHVEAGRRDEEIAVSVRDEGPGIEPEHLPRLFERFYRVEKGRERSSGGTGLGLAIVKHIVRNHHGRVEVDSTPGEGSTFTIILPAA